ncbi:MBL fold metallo-hydrolase [Leifsonia sp. EB34]|uniref:MBL fold metallo-hydrolase n=1 Tax=Leifsonia sp. EB34 TaxID=3156303 RepID=UPI00351616C2
MTTPATTPTPCRPRVLSLGGPSLLIEFGGARFVVDPTFDRAGEYPVGSRVLTKTTDARLQPDELGSVDAVLLSHDQHPDNLDRGGRAYLRTVPLVVTTPLAAGRLDAACRGFEPWDSVVVGGVTVTAVPAQHGPDGTEAATGPVTGFVLEAEGSPTLYISGDNASLRLVAEIAEHFPAIELAVLFAGAASTPLVDGFLTLTSAEAAEAARILGRPRVLPAHAEGWAHFTEGTDDYVAAFAAAGLGDLLLDSTPGTWASI